MSSTSEFRSTENQSIFSIQVINVSFDLNQIETETKKEVRMKISLDKDKLHLT